MLIPLYQIASFLFLILFLFSLLIIFILSKKLSKLKQSLNKLTEETISLATYNELVTKIANLKETQTSVIKAARQESIIKSKAVNRGQVAETFIPFKFDELDPKDFKFLGDPIDYIVYKGMNQTRNTEPYIEEILFLEVKTGDSRLNKTQRAIRDCITEKRIKFTVINQDKEK